MVTSMLEFGHYLAKYSDRFEHIVTVRLLSLRLKAFNEYLRIPIEIRYPV